MIVNLVESDAAKIPDVENCEGRFPGGKKKEERDPWNI